MPLKYLTDGIKTWNKILHSNFHFEEIMFSLRRHILKIIDRYSVIYYLAKAERERERERERDRLIFI